MPGLVGHGTLFALRAKGDSMIEAVICDGDILPGPTKNTWRLRHSEALTLDLVFTDVLVSFYTT
jgi:hypothetical protein